MKFDEDNVTGMLDNFRKKVNPASEKVLYRHHSFLNGDFPTEIDITQDRYTYLVNLFSTASTALFLSGLAPATGTTRLTRHKKIVELYKEIHAKRLANDIDGSSSAMEQISSIHAKLLTLLERQEVVMKVSSLTSGDIAKYVIESLQIRGKLTPVWKRLFQVDDPNNERGAWVKSVLNRREFRFGETALDPVRYGVKQSKSNYEVEFGLLHQRIGTLDFPAPDGTGIAVGIKVISNSINGHNGWWCIPPTNPLGSSAFKIEVKTEGTHGMNVSIPLH